MDANRKRQLDRARLERDLRFTAQQAEMPFASFVLLNALFMGVVYFLIMWFSAEEPLDLMRVAITSALLGLGYGVTMRAFMKWYHRRLKRKYEALLGES